MVNQTLAVTVEDFFSPEMEQSMLNTSFIFSGSESQSQLVIQPFRSDSVDYILCPLGRSGFECSGEVEIDGWIYDFSQIPYTYFFGLTIRPANPTNPDNSRVVPAMFTTIYTLDGKVNRTDIFSDFSSYERQLNFTSDRNGTVSMPVVRDLTGDYIMHLDVRLSDVGNKQRQMNFTGYQNLDSKWTLFRSIDNFTLSYQVEVTEEAYSLRFESEYGRDSIECSLSSYCIGYALLGYWNVESISVYNNELNLYTGIVMNFTHAVAKDVYITESLDLANSNATIVVEDDEGV
mmetsp:Transcript_28302/g.33244  ORF Transcript_28302/g.33244 Transcript_28302/m.33244 type:complete len:290 (-) Transcript_28302:633-1502(-)|eukprot:CAMPEP_0185612978 /NCGR_PEP_ID=MMETSP0436-20130131/24463_1 /TAXON_ID=626734 ORGANISM="Favella taraikaensis, Strain Fe Narragansett Bay" /NCGR_SAMPLE_ID=MMETSP0436 /ASSEMBLY_ACC=CAM_ASM_000390 /LENGTH=289 /DNA_ID=CAMNT_0028246703 /DNA_START=260 /DNA_END=1129 /DNA_ORIENTATION=-